MSVKPYVLDGQKYALKRQPHPRVTDHEIWVHSELSKLQLPTILPFLGVVTKSKTRVLGSSTLYEEQKHYIKTPWIDTLSPDEMSAEEKRTVQALINYTFSVIPGFNHGDFGMHNIFFVRRDITLGGITSSITPIIFDFEYSTYMGREPVFEGKPDQIVSFPESDHH